MWVKTQYGKIYNGDAIASFELVELDAAGGVLSEPQHNSSNLAVKWIIVGQTFEFGDKILFGEYETREAAMVRLNSFFGAEDHSRNFDFT